MKNSNELPAFEHPFVQAVYNMLCEQGIASKPADEHWEGWIARQIGALHLETAARDSHVDGAHEPNEKLLALADRIDPDQLWRRPGMAHAEWTQAQKDQLQAGVSLRRYADLLGQNNWRIFPPKPGLCFQSSTLDGVVAMATKFHSRRSQPDNTA